MNKKCLTIIILLLLVIAASIYKSMFQGSALNITDGRTTIQLSHDERDLIQAEMRAFLTSVQQITKGISENNMELVTDYARKVGRATQGDVPTTLTAKLPRQFKQLGFDTHTRFDQLALDADDLGDGNHALSQLSNLMNNCTSCHAMYRIETTSK